MKLGVVMLFLSFTFVWTQYAVGASWSWIRQLGTTSLLVYWVHIELVYGRWFGSRKETMGNIECAVYAVILIALMLGVSLARTNWRTLKTNAQAWFSYRSPRRVSGD